MTTSAAESRRWWLGPLLWSLAILGGIVIACRVNETAREVVMEGVGYFFAFFSTPFILEASLFIGGLGIVMIINGLRMEREGDGWVEMEVKEEKPASEETR
jgi:putative Mn2+ efflux pump MntP